MRITGTRQGLLVTNLSVRWHTGRLGPHPFKALYPLHSLTSVSSCSQLVRASWENLAEWHDLFPMQTCI